MKQKAVVICPGRGTYNKDELGYLSRHHADKKDMIDAFDGYRRQTGQDTVSELDGAESFSLSRHSRGDNASPLIYACSYLDYLAIDRDAFDIVAVTGNSMGWYTALGCAFAATEMNALHIVNTMGTMMQENLVGGQIIYALVDDDWRPIPGRREVLMSLIEEIDGLHLSIELGGMLVFGGTDDALKTLEGRLEPEGRFPMRLQNHAAFHTELLKHISDKARETIDAGWLKQPDVPLIDGRGKIWPPFSTDVDELWDYTFGHQVHRYYDFTAAVQVAAKEFAPDAMIVLGPGATLGGAVAQSLIDINWLGWSCKDDFITRQKSAPYLVSMGMDGQRDLATGETGQRRKKA